MDTYIFIPLSIWGVLLFLLFFRVELPFSIKLVMFFILASSIFFWYDELLYLINHFESFQLKQYTQIMLNAVYSVFMALMWIWPLTLLFVFYAASDLDSIRMIIILSFFTLFIWILFFIGTFFSS